MPDITSAASAEVQARAESMGWIPPTRFKGDAADFVDADEYVRRGEEKLPIIKQRLVAAERDRDALKGQVGGLNTRVGEMAKQLEEINLRHSVDKQKAVEQAIADTKAALAKAGAAGDHAAVAELTGDLTELQAEKKAAENEVTAAKTKPAEKKDTSTTQTIDPEQAEWNAENPWFGTDRRRTALALGIATELREAGDKTQGKAFLNKVKAEVLKTLGASEAPADSKVDGGRHGSDQTQQRNGGRKDYASMPADARAACDADARQFVGKGKKYENVDQWRKAYADIYYAT